MTRFGMFRIMRYAEGVKFQSPRVATQPRTLGCGVQPLRGRNRQERVDQEISCRHARRSLHFWHEAHHRHYSAK